MSIAIAAAGDSSGPAGEAPRRGPAVSRLLRRLPVVGRLLLVVLLNIVALVVLAAVLWVSAGDLRGAWDDLRAAHASSGHIVVLERAAYRLHREVQAFLERPDEAHREAVEAAKSGFTGALWAARDGVGAAARGDVADYAEIARRYLFGFDDLRGLEIDIALLYDNDFADLVEAMRIRLDALDAAIPARDVTLRPLVARAYDRFAEFRVDLVAYRRERSSELLARARAARDVLEATLTEIGRAPTPDGRSLAIELFRPDLAIMDAIFARLDEIADKKARWLAGLVDGNRVAMSEALSRAVERQERREQAAIETFDGLFRSTAERFLAIALLFLAGSVLASLAVARSIREPLAAARGAMQAVVIGDLDRPIVGLDARDEIGSIARSIEVFRREVADTRRREEEHAAQERRWYSILETSPIGIAVLSAEDASLLFCNQRWTSLFGLGPDDPAPPIRTWFARIADAARLSADLRRDGRASAWLAKMRRGGEGTWWGLFEVHPIVFTGRPAHIFWAYDVSDGRRAEEDLRLAKERAETALADLAEAQRGLVEAEKLAALGGLVAGVAHEVNNPVGIGLTVASSLSNRVTAFAAEVASGNLRRSRLDSFLADCRDAADQLVANLGRAGDLVRAFKQVAVDRTRADRRRFDLAEATAEILASLHPSLARTPHRLETDIPPGIVLDGYPGAWGQILTNLFMNALTHAFPAGREGTLTLTARALSPTEVEIVFADDGVGMAAEVARQAFEPFFTTRRGQGGSGLGLHIVYNILVHRLGGRVTLDTAPGRGTRLRMVIPSVAPEATADDPVNEERT